MINTKIRCSKCYQTADITPGSDFQKCGVCGVYSKYSSLKILRSARVSFGEEQILFYDNQLSEYAQKFDLNIEDEKVFTEHFLKDEQTSVVVNQRNICVCIL